MIKIGVYLSVGPHAGGSFQYCLSVIKNLNLINKKKYKVIIFTNKNFWINRLNSKYKIIKLDSNNFLGQIINYFYFLLKPLKLFKTVNNLFCKNVRKMNNEKCDIIIFPSQEDFSSKIYTKSITVIHDLMHKYESKFKEYNLIEKIRRDIQYNKICKFSYKIFVDSDMGKKHVLESYNVERSKIFIANFEIPEYLKNSKKIDIFKKYKIPKKKYLFYPAQFWEHKNHLNLLRAFKLINKNFKNINLVLVGIEKNNIFRIKKEIENLNLNNNVFIIGYVSNKDIYSFYKNALILTYVSFCGPTNIPPLEAMYTGCPIICSNVYGMPKQIGNAGLLVNPKSYQDIYKKIKIIINNKSVKNRVVKQGYFQLKKNNKQSFYNSLNKVLDNL